MTKVKRSTRARKLPPNPLPLPAREPPPPPPTQEGAFDYVRTRADVLRMLEEGFIAAREPTHEDEEAYEDQVYDQAYDDAVSALITLEGIAAREIWTVYVEYDSGELETEVLYVEQAAKDHVEEVLGLTGGTLAQWTVPEDHDVYELFQDRGVRRLSVDRTVIPLVPTESSREPSTTHIF